MTAKIKLDTDEVIRLYVEDRLTTQKIADLFGCSRFPIESLLRANNVEARSNHVGKYFEKEIVELYSSGLKVNEIQERLGLKRDAVIGRLKKNGISLTTPRELCSSRFYKTSPCWKGYEDIPLSVYSHIAKRARHNNIEISIDIKDMWEQYLVQDKICSLSGISLNLRKGIRDIGNCSLDRIDSGRGYSKDNIQWVFKIINSMKREYPEWYFLLICKLVCSPPDIQFDNQKIEYSDVSYYYNEIKNKHNHHKTRSKRFDFTITKDDVIELYDEQNGKCAYTNTPLVFRNKKNIHIKNVVSIDRTDSRLGYNRNNIQLVHKDVNIVKYTSSHTDFVELCSTITNFQENKNGI